MNRNRSSRFRKRDSQGRSGQGLQAAIAALAAAILVVPIWHRPSDDQMRIPIGYNERVKALVEDGKLIPRDDAIGFVQAPDLAPEVQEFIDVSFLKTDLDEEGSAIWGEHGIDPNAHREVGPSDAIVSWTGDLRFRSLDDVLGGTGWGRPALSLIHVDTRKKWRVTAGRPEGCQTVIINLANMQEANQAGCKIILARDNRFAMDLFLVGNQPVLRLDGNLPRAIRIDGQPVELGSSERLVPLFPQGLGEARRQAIDLDIDVDGLRTQHFRLTEHLPLISSRRASSSFGASDEFTDLSGRRYFAGLESFARPIEGQMKQGDFTTTLIEELQLAGRKYLREEAEKVQKAKGGAISFRASATLMDGLTGEIVALPTWPAGPDDLAARDRDLSGALQLFADNNNFVNQPIGSTAKVPFAAAITTRFPELLRLKLTSQQNPYSCFMGWNKLTPTTEHGLGDDIDFANFIGRSSNRYAQSLMLLALADTRPTGPFPTQVDPRWRPLCNGEPSFSIDGRQYTSRPSLGDWDAAVSKKTAASAGRAWSSLLAEMFCLDPEEQVIGERYPGCSRVLWEPGSALADAKVHRLPPIALEFNKVRDLNSEYLMTILGGARSQWSTIRLAQAYARVVTWLAVQPRLDLRKGGQDAQAVPSLLGRNPTDVDAQNSVKAKVRETILKGMERVFLPSPDGTAFKLAALRDEITTPRPGDTTTLKLYGKTGTPAVVRLSRPTEGAQALSDFNKARCGLKGETLPDNRGVRLFVGGSGRSDLDAIKALDQGPCSRFANDRTAGLIAREIASRNRSALRFAAAIDSLGRVTLESLNRNDGGTEDGKLFVLVAARYKNGSKEPCAVSVIASNFAANNSGSAALNFTAAMLRDPEVRRWIERKPASCS